MIDEKIEFWRARMLHIYTENTKDIQKIYLKYREKICNKPVNKSKSNQIKTKSNLKLNLTPNEI